jgi:hypothetical protein
MNLFYYPNFTTIYLNRCIWSDLAVNFEEPILCSQSNSQQNRSYNTKTRPIPVYLEYDTIRNTTVLIDSKSGQRLPEKM